MIPTMPSELTHFVDILLRVRNEYVRVTGKRPTEYITSQETFDAMALALEIDSFARLVPTPRDRPRSLFDGPSSPRILSFCGVPVRPGAPDGTEYGAFIVADPPSALRERSE